ncbi:O-antigen ligase family protein [candidate division KSB1 bacterium]|nr:O-antigen ligase family protein [candidate division KSB1 bacterium]
MPGKLQYEAYRLGPLDITLNYFKKIIFEQRFGNWFGFLYAILGGCFFAVVLATQGFKLGIVLIGGVVGAPFAFAAIFNPFFGVIFIISTTYFLLGIKRMVPAIPLGMFTDFMVVFLAFGVFYKNLYEKEWGFLKGAISKTVAIYMVYVFASVFNPDASCTMCYIYTIRSMAGYMIMYFIVSYVIRTKKDIKLFIKIWIGLSLLAALYAFKQEYLGLAGYENRWLHASEERFWLIYQWGRIRKFSFMADPTAFGICMGYSGTMVIALALGKFTRRKKIILGFIALVMFQAMLFSGTRAAFVMPVLGAAFYVMLARNKKLYIAAVIGAVMFLALIKAPIYLGPTFKRFQSAFNASEDASFQVRLENQRMIRPWIWRHPLGGGLGATGVWGERFAPNAFLSTFPPDSGYVRVAVELGWVGLTLYMLLWIAIFKQGINSFFIIRDPVLKSIALSMLCVLFCLMVVNYPQEAIKQLPTSLLFWVAAAVVSRAGQIDMEEQQKKIKALKQKAKKQKAVEAPVS